MNEELRNLVKRFGAGRDEIRVGDEVLGMGGRRTYPPKNERHFVVHARVESISGDSATILVFEHHYLDGGRSDVNERFDVPLSELKKPLSDQVREHFDIWNHLLV